MKIAAEIEWRKDGWGREASALYLGALYVGEIMQCTHPDHHLGEWRGWFMQDDSGDETGWFDTAELARASVEKRLFDAINIQRDDT